MPEARADQAEGLRRLFAPACTECVPVLAGSAADARLAGDLAAACERIGRDVLVIDASAGAVALALGLAARRELEHALAGELELADVLLHAGDRLAVLPARRGLARMAARGVAVAALAARVRPRADLALVHAPADALAATGIALSADIVLPVGDGEAAMKAAYAQIKRAGALGGRFRVVVHGTTSAAGALERFVTLARTARRFLDAELVFGGYVPPDPAFRAAAAASRSVFAVAPHSAGARALEVIACMLGERRPPLVH